MDLGSQLVPNLLQKIYIHNYIYIVLYNISLLVLRCVKNINKYFILVCKAFLPILSSGGGAGGYGGEGVRGGEADPPSQY